MSEGLNPLRIVKNWNQGTTSREENWDEIANKTVAFGLQTNNNFKQLGLDIGGSSYAFNGTGKGTQSTSITSRLTTLESQSGIIGSRNLGLDLSTPSKIKIIGADGNNLSSSNTGLVSFNSTSDVGQIVTRSITDNMEVTLTGTHWGNDTFGDLTDYVLWILMIDTGTDAILGVAAKGGMKTVISTDAFTAPGSVVGIEDVLVSSAPASTYNCTYIGWVYADFDDTGNGGGENFWTVQSGVGDVNFQACPTIHEGEVRW